MNLNPLINKVRKSSLFGLFQIIRANLIFGLKNPNAFIFKQKYLERLELQLTNVDKDIIFIVTIPGSLHIVELCLQFVPPEVSIAIIANGLSDWENRWIKEHLQYKYLFSIPDTLSHGEVINALVKSVDVKSVEYFFGILDYDCFVFNPDLFYQAAKIKDNHQECLLQQYQSYNKSGITGNILPDDQCTVV